MQKRIVITGGAGLVGQNLIVQLEKAGYSNITVLDKHQVNLGILRRMHPEVVVECVDLAEPGAWERHFANAWVAVILHAQIGHPDLEPFTRNNILATVKVLDAIKRHGVSYTVHVSSSVVNSVADDHYTNTKREQERLVTASGLSNVILRPTLMFGWFDRKHLGWLARFMKKSPLFPIPGNGHFSRQPLYAADFSRIILSCIERRPPAKIYDITGRERIDYIDIIRAIKRATASKSILMKIPIPVFSTLLKTWALFDNDPPFTAQQLAALVADDEFEVIDWPGTFDVTATPFHAAIAETFTNATYAHVVLDF